MNGLDLSPAPGAAAAPRRVVAHARVETTLLLRNGEQLLLALVIPVGLLGMGRLLGGRFGALDQLAPSVFALAVWSSAFTSLAIATGFERRYGVLERLAATPLGRAGLLSGKAVSVGIVVGGQLIVLGLAAAALGWRPRWTVGSSGGGLLLVVLATAAFSCLALALAGRLRAEATLALANVIYVVLLAGGALVLPLSNYPSAVQAVVMFLPTAALGEGLRAAGTGVVLGWPVPVLAGWVVVGAFAAWKGFRWTS